MDTESQSKGAISLLTFLLMVAMLVGVIAAMVSGVMWLVDHSAYWSAPEVEAVYSRKRVVSAAVEVEATPIPTQPAYTPTPDPPHALPPIRTETEQYTVRSGDSLGYIAGLYGISVEQIVKENKLANPNILEVGQVLTLPVPVPDNTGPRNKIVPDSELVYGPSNSTFSVDAFVEEQGGYLAGYSEEVGDVTLSGSQIVQRLAQNYSVNPRLLLAVLEYQSGWVTRTNPPESTLKKPIADLGKNARGLYKQLSWVANNLNMGYYLWRVNGVSTWILGDDSTIRIDPTINAGTAGVQHLFAPLYDVEGWKKAVSEEGVFATFTSLFGSPFSYTVEPLLPSNLQQPIMQLPIEKNKIWSFTGGPHGGYGSGSAWAALDFAPPGDALGCVQSDEWVVAVADGLILRSADGSVLQDLDGDGVEGTGWVVLYMHIETRDRIETGKKVKAGDRIGHPSCEGGVSNGTHVHLARRYNGEWIPADQNIPFNLDGWISSGTGQPYDGYLTRNGQVVEAYAGRSEINQIQR